MTWRGEASDTAVNGCTRRPGKRVDGDETGVRKIDAGTAAVRARKETMPQTDHVRITMSDVPPTASSMAAASRWCREFYHKHRDAVRAYIRGCTQLSALLCIAVLRRSIRPAPAARVPCVRACACIVPAVAPAGKSAYHMVPCMVRRLTAVGTYIVRHAMVVCTCHRCTASV
jgi:hypothetical protein